jgi:putative phosphonate metabolism protein
VGERWAVYFAPPRGTPLESLTSQWLGRDPAGRPVPQPVLPGLPANRVRDLTEAPSRYGFHATLKAPFTLAEGTDSAGLSEAARQFAADHSPIILPPLRVAIIGDFVAFVPSGPAAAIDRLAEHCQSTFEPFRAPLTAEDIARRKDAGLTPRQEELLARWGYPYVMEEFRFHMTLTGPIGNGAERTRVATILGQRLAAFCRGPMAVDAIALFAQPERSQPFTLRASFPLGG